MTRAATRTRLRVVEAGAVSDALAEALAGGDPVAPLPADSVARQAALAMLRPDEPVTEPDAAVVVATSGSSGTAKGVVLTRAAIRAAAAATAERLGGAGDWALALPAHYVAGLMVHARALLGGRAVLPVRGDLADLPEAAARMAGPRYLSVVAAQLARALPRPELADALARFDAVLLGGGPADPALVAAARDRGVRVVTTYGMTETGGGCVYDGVPLPGVTLAFEPDERIAIGGPMVFAGYRGQPDLTAECLVGGMFRTSDRGRIEDGRLRVLGRADQLVITGGHKVDLAAVEAAVRAATGDPLAVVLAVPDPTWGSVIVAATVADTTLDRLQPGLAGWLPAYALPRRLLRLDHTPQLASGKPDRQAIEELAR